jgi:hypothetical protein
MTSALIGGAPRRKAAEASRPLPIVWWNRIVVTQSNVRGWKMTPSIYIGQDLTDVWIDGLALGRRDPAPAASNPDRRTVRNDPATHVPRIAL